MSALATATGGEGSRRPSPERLEQPQAKYLLFGSWVVLLQGALIMLFLPILVFTTKEDIPPAEIAMFGLMGVLALAGGGALYVARRWTWWVAVAATVTCSAYLLSVGGLTEPREGYVATVFAVVAVILLLLGKPAAGNTEALALASAKVPFRLKVTATWVAIFFILGIFLVLSDLDRGFIRENFRYIAGWAQIHDPARVLRDHPGHDPRAAGCARSPVAQRRRLRRLGLLHVVLPWHAVDRPAVPDLPRPAADRAQPPSAPRSSTSSP